MRLPIEIWNPTLTRSATGGTQEVYSKTTDDFAEIKDGSLNKFNTVVAVGEELVKRFTIDARPSLVLTQKSRIKYDDNFYTITTIQKKDNKGFHLVIEGRAKI